jgi:glycerol-3-phosphate acyltransferase PlsY
MTLNDITISFIALAVLLGHIFPIYYRFNGGKGVATAFGIFLGLDLFFAAIILCVWIITFLIWRYSSLAAIIASISAPVVAWLLSLSQEFILLTLVIAVIVLCRHQSNINNLIHGNEKGFKK